MASDFGYPKEMALTEITCDARLQMRVGNNDPEHVRGMVDLLNDPDYANLDVNKKLPRIHVCAVGTEYFVVDGFHRYAAHQIAGCARIKCYVRASTFEQALIAAAGANKDQKAMMRTGLDKRFAAQQLLIAFKDDAKYTDRAIAECIGTSHTMVGDVRRELEAKGHRKAKPKAEGETKADPRTERPGSNGKPKGPPSRSGKPLFDWKFMMEMRRREVQALDSLVKHFPDIFPDGQRSREWIAHNRLLCEMFDSWDDLHKLVIRKLEEKARTE